MKIWRLGQILHQTDWQIFRSNKMLSFDWLKPTVNYSNVTDFKKLGGWTCIKPWIEEVQKGDLIFLMNKNLYAGISIVKDTYKYKKYDLNLGKYILPSIPVEFIHSLTIPQRHNLDIKASEPKTFYYINGLGFNLFKVMEFLKNTYPSQQKLTAKYLIDHAKAESNKISRVCWNTHDWKKPSGPDGKDNSAKTYEGINGFGHEEWIAEKFRIIDGYHYGFLQTLNLKYDTHVDNIYNIDLVTSDREGSIYHAGIIRNAICISKEESNKASEVYKKVGWIDEMKKEINGIGGNIKNFIDDKINSLFNIKYKIENVEIYEDIKLIDRIDINIKTHRYKLLPKVQEFKYASLNTDIEDKLKNTKRVTRTINTTTSYDVAHNKIQNGILKLLHASNLYEFIDSEYNNIDVVAKLKNGLWQYYEVKTFASVKKSIRNALGQIIEYSYWPGRTSADKLIIISEEDVNDDAIKYLNLLRNKFKLPVYYQSFKIPTNELSELV